MKRIVSAIVFLPVFFLIVQYGNHVVFFIFLSTILLTALFEFYTLLDQNGPKCMIYTGMILGWFISFSFFSNQNQLIHFSMVLLIMGTFIVKLFSKQPIKRRGAATERSSRSSKLTEKTCSKNKFLQFNSINSSVEKISNTLFGVLYIGLLLSYLIFIRKDDQGRLLIFMLFFIIWSGDTFSYYIGTLIGKHPLAPLISPNKTYEGALGGVLGSLGGALLAKYWFYLNISVANSIILGVVTGIAGQIGDLCESMLKRNLKVKDSGFLIPGHGGLLDRLDSVLFAAPVFYYLLLYIS